MRQFVEVGIGGAMFETRHCGLIGGEQIGMSRQTTGDCLKHGQGCIEHRLLLDKSGHQTVLPLHRAIIGLAFAGNNAQQRRLAGAVAANQANAFTRFEAELHAIE